MRCFLLFFAFLPGLVSGSQIDQAVVRAVESLSRPLADEGDLDGLIESAAGRRLVLLGEATHGTREFYAWRAAISRRLVAEHGFAFIAVEGDWTALDALDRYVRGRDGAAASAREALLGIQRWPRWMWANDEIEALGEWLREFNHDLPPGRRVGFHGIDVYGMWESLESVIEFYGENLPEAATKVRALYAGLRAFSEDLQSYARHSMVVSSEEEVARVAEKLRERLRNADPEDVEALFDAYQNARVVQAGESHARGMTVGGAASWNARVRHFKDTVGRLLDHYGPESRGIVWAHNTHIGDARATDMARIGQVNIGQLARERFGLDEVFAVGFGTGGGTVLAGRRWEGPRERMTIPAPRPDSIEAVFGLAGSEDRWLLFETDGDAAEVLRRNAPHRAIGVVYHPENERRGNYVPTRLAERYDAFIFLPETSALTPLHAP